MSFERLFHPKGIAIIGASADLGRIGGHPIKALKNAGYKGGIFPINPKYPELHGLACFPDVMSLKEPCDLAVVAVPAPGVAKAIRDCGKAGIPFAVVLTAGFRETGAEGRKLEAELKAAVAESGVRIVGPNCQGMLSIQSRVFAAFGSVADETDFRPGAVSCAFQSGGFGYAIVNLAEAQGVGFRYCVSSGNETDIAMPELLSAFLDDPGTSLAFAYLEGTPDARPLLDVGRKSLETGKPVLIWKAGTTDAGVKAAASHTANMTGTYDLYRAAMRQCGIIEVDDVEPIVDLAKLFGQGRLPKGNTVGVLSISGGSGVVFADAAVRGGLTLPPFAPQTLARLRQMIPAFGSAENPADITAALFNDKTLFARTLELVLADEGLDQLVVLIASISGASAAHCCEVDRRRGGQDRQARQRAVVGPAGQVGGRRKGAGGGGRAVRDHAGAACACGGDPGALCRRPAAAAAAQGAEGHDAEGPRAACRGRHAQRGREQGRAAHVRHPGGQGGVRCGRQRRGRGEQRAQGAVRGQGRLTRRAAQDGSRRREARRVARGACARRRGWSSTTRGSTCPARPSTACWCRRWRRASRR